MVYHTILIYCLDYFWKDSLSSHYVSQSIYCILVTIHQASQRFLSLPIEWLITVRGIIQAILYFTFICYNFNVFELFILMPGLFLDMSLILICFPTHGKWPSRVDRDRGRIFDHWWCLPALCPNLWLKLVCNLHINYNF